MGQRGIMQQCSGIDSWSSCSICQILDILARAELEYAAGMQQDWQAPTLEIYQDEVECVVHAMGVLDDAVSSLRVQLSG